MTKRLFTIFLAVVMIVAAISLTACGDNSDSGPDNLPPVNDGGNSTGKTTLSAPDGSTVEMPASVTKIVTVSPSAKSIIDALGKSSVIVGSYGVDEDATSKIVSAAPEVVLYDEGAKIDVAAIEAANIIAVKIPNPTSMTAVNSHITFIGRVIGASTDSMTTSITNDMNALRTMSQSTPKLNVYFEIGSGDDGYYTVAPYSYIYEVLSAAGGVNIFGESSGKEGFVTVSADEIIAANPDVIFTLGSASDITSRDGWSEINAVVNGHVYTIDKMNGSSDAVAAGQSMSDTLRKAAESLGADE